MKKKLKMALSRLPRLPRKWRLVRNVICILLAVYFIWLFLDCRSLTMMGAFRRTEREQMLGPSEVVYRTKDGAATWLLGKITDGYLATGVRWDLGWKTRYFTFWEKGENVTLVPVGYYPQGRADSVELLLFHEMNGVVRGEAEVTLNATVGFGDGDVKAYEEGSVTETYLIQFEPCGEQALAGWIEPHFPDDGSLKNRTEKYAIGTVFGSDEILSFVVWLYDGEGNVVYHGTIEYSYTD